MKTRNSYYSNRMFIFILILALFPVSGMGADKIVAKVGNQQITLSELNTELEISTIALDTIGENLKTGRRKVLDDIVNNRILLLEANALKIEPDPKIVEEYYKTQKNSFKTETKFQQELKKRKLTDKQFRQAIMDEMRVTELLHIYVYSKINSPISLKEAQAYYQQNSTLFITPDSVRIRHIFIVASTEWSSEDKLKKLNKAREAYDLINKGKDFSEVAIDYSESNRAAFGGDIGRFIRKGELDSYPEIENAAFQLGIGQYSQILQSPAGYHIIKVEERVYGHLKPFELVKSEILEQLQKKRAENQFNDWFTTLKSKYPVEIYEENL